MSEVISKNIEKLSEKIERRRRFQEKRTKKLRELQEDLNVLLYSHHAKPFLTSYTDQHKEMIEYIMMQESPSHIGENILGLCHWDYAIQSQAQIVNPETIPEIRGIHLATAKENIEFLSTEESTQYIKGAIQRQLDYIKQFGGSEVPQQYNSFIAGLEKLIE